MKDYSRKKTETKMVMMQLICLLMAVVLISSLAGVGPMRAYADNPTNAPVYEGDGWYSWVVPYMEEYNLSIDSDLHEYEGEIVYFYDLPIVDIAEWQYDDFAVAADMSARLNVSVLTMTLSHQLNPSNNALSLTGHITNTGGATVTWRGFWLRRHDIADVREISGGGGNVAFHSPQIGGLTPGQRYLFRVVARTTCYANIHQGPAGEVTIPTSSVNTPTPPPTWPTSTPPPVWPTPTPPPGSNPTPTPPPAGLNLSPSTWTCSGNGSRMTLAINVGIDQPWMLEQSLGSHYWLTIDSPGLGRSVFAGTSSAQREITTQLNDTGITRTARIYARSGVLPPQIFTVTQHSAVPAATMRGPRVIECFSRFGYVDVRGTATNTNIEVNTRANVARPLWDFVHLRGNEFAIRNDTTGHLFTATDGGLRYQASISGDIRNPDRSQRWVVVPQGNGVYRIRSVSNGRYIVDGALNLTLADRNPTSNRQLWRIGFMWNVHSRYVHQDGGAANWVGFWPETININVRPIGPQPNGFDFVTKMGIAQRTWIDALGIAFRPINMEAANIRAYGGNRYAINGHLGLEVPLRQRYGVTRVFRHTRDYNSRVEIQAGGATRGVFRLHGYGSTHTHSHSGDIGPAVIMAVFSDNENQFADSGNHYASNSHNIRFATMSAIHELGHALGYPGHSPNSSDVMMGPIPAHMLRPNEVLNPAEIVHLRQIYRNFR